MLYIRGRAKNKGVFVQCVSKLLYHKMMGTLMPVSQMMKGDSAASSFKLITFLIMHIMTKLNYFIFHHL